jgi:lysophospholipase L1-like esterase
MADAAKDYLSYSNDGVHPNKAGYQVMELLVENAISLILS